jgi:hypothetical protein
LAGAICPLCTKPFTEIRHQRCHDCLVINDTTSVDYDTTIVGAHTIEYHAPLEDDDNDDDVIDNDNNDDNDNNIDPDACMICGKGVASHEHGNPLTSHQQLASMIQCTSCELMIHVKCLSNPIIVTNNWRCASCQLSRNQLAHLLKLDSHQSRVPPASSPSSSPTAKRQSLSNGRSSRLLAIATPTLVMAHKDTSQSTALPTSSSSASLRSERKGNTTASVHTPAYFLRLLSLSHLSANSTVRNNVSSTITTDHSRWVKRLTSRLTDSFHSPIASSSTSTSTSDVVHDRVGKRQHSWSLFMRQIGNARSTARVNERKEQQQRQTSNSERRDVNGMTRSQRRHHLNMLLERIQWRQRQLQQQHKHKNIVNDTNIVHRSKGVKETKSVGVVLVSEPTISQSPSISTSTPKVTTASQATNKNNVPRIGGGGQWNSNDELILVTSSQHANIKQKELRNKLDESVDELLQAPSQQLYLANQRQRERDEAKQLSTIRRDSQLNNQRQHDSMASHKRLIHMQANAIKTVDEIEVREAQLRNAVEASLIIPSSTPIAVNTSSKRSRHDRDKHTKDGRGHAHKHKHKRERLTTSSNSSVVSDDSRQQIHNHIQAYVMSLVVTSSMAMSSSSTISISKLSTKVLDDWLQQPMKSTDYVMLNDWLRQPKRHSRIVSSLAKYLAVSTP